MCVYSGGMFHYSTKASIYGINNPDSILYKKDDHNPLINEFGIYIIDRLCALSVADSAECLKRRVWRKFMKRCFFNIMDTSRMFQQHDIA